MESLIKKEISAAVDNLALIKISLESDRARLEACCGMIAESISRGGKILVAGNGGSAADAQHFAAELVGRYRRERKGYPAISLATDTSALTAIGNDYGFGSVFSRQVEALGVPGDVLVGISTSGNSENILAALKKAREAGMGTISLTGGGGGSAAEMADISIVFPAADTPRIQEYHAVVLHIMAADIDSRELKKSRG